MFKRSLELPSDRDVAVERDSHNPNANPKHFFSLPRLFQNLPVQYRWILQRSAVMRDRREPTFMLLVSVGSWDFCHLFVRIISWSHS